MKVIIYIISVMSLIYSDLKVQNLSHNKKNLHRDQVQMIYIAELGVREKTGNNDGPKVEEYLRYVGLQKGDPWCAAFVCWVFDQAGVVNLRTGWSPALFPKDKIVWNRNNVSGAGKGVGVAGRQVEGRSVAGAAKRLPEKGDVFGIWFPDKGRIAHVGFVDTWGEKWVITVEGNTNEAGSREGDGVWRKRRLVQSVYQVSDFIRR